MSERAEGYMNGWQAGYHNATLAERKRIFDIIRGEEEMTYQDKAEATREFYRRQGEDRERTRILTLLQMLENKTPDASWSPKYIMKLVNREA